MAEERAGKEPGFTWFFFVPPAARKRPAPRKETRRKQGDHGHTHRPPAAQRPPGRPQAAQGGGGAPRRGRKRARGPEGRSPGQKANISFGLFGRGPRGKGEAGAPKASTAPRPSRTTTKDERRGKKRAPRLSEARATNGSPKQSGARAQATEERPPRGHAGGERRAASNRPKTARPQDGHPPGGQTHTRPAPPQRPPRRGGRRRGRDALADCEQGRIPRTPARPPQGRATGQGAGGRAKRPLPDEPGEMHEKQATVPGEALPHRAPAAGT
jgi:hypothetical protein